mgnify:CR=1 FL=1
MLAWHFLQQDRCLQWGTKEEVIPGKKIIVLPPLEMCRHGLHASKDAIDAISYAPDPVVCRVMLSGEILYDKDKCCATERIVLWMADATMVLHEFACWCAEEALLNERRAGWEPDAKFWAAIQAKRDWLSGKIDLDKLAAAKEAALIEVWTQSDAAAWTPSWSAAQGAVLAAAEADALNAARIAAQGAARAAARAAISKAAKGASHEAVSEAAWLTVRAAQNAKLTEMILTLEAPSLRLEPIETDGAR